MEIWVGVALFVFGVVLLGAIVWIDNLIADRRRRMHAIERWEKNCGIRPLPGDSLQVRQDRVRRAMSGQR